MVGLMSNPLLTDVELDLSNNEVIINYCFQATVCFMEF